MSIKQLPIKEFYSFGNSLIEKTRNLILQLWQENKFATELKEDKTPVTVVDLQAEQMLREIIQRNYPTHGIIGEEYENTNPDAEFQWTIDPIDGTQNLVNRIPTFGTLLGLRYQGKAILGFIDIPVLDILCHGALGMGVFCNNKKQILKDLQSAKLEHTDLIGSSTLDVFKRSGEEEKLFKVMNFHPHTRIYYDCYAHILAITGSLAAMVEFNLKIWDFTPTEFLLQEAGGKFVYLNKWSPDNPRDLAHAIFGKPTAVDLIVQELKY